MRHGIITVRHGGEQAFVMGGDTFPSLYFNNVAGW